jgi:hypothetical protein
VRALVRENRLQGVRPCFYTAGAWWKDEHDIPPDILERAIEAIS